MKIKYAAIFDYINKLNENPDKHFSNACKLAMELGEHVDENIHLSKANIEIKVMQLLEYNVITPVSVLLELSMPIARAVRYEEKVGFGYVNTSRLSYIPDNSNSYTKLGRLNEKGESLFYCCLDQHSNSTATMLSECRAEKGETFNFLHCLTNNINNEEYLRTPPCLFIVPIGVNYYFRRATPDPFGLGQDFRDICKLISDTAHPTLLEAFDICDEFLTLVLSLPERPSLYEVTSAIAKKCMSHPDIDGVIYPSTQFGEHPNIALKPSSVDRKIEYVSVTSIKIEDFCCNNGYKTKILALGTITNDTITW